MTTELTPHTKYHRFVFWLFLVPGTLLCLEFCNEWITAMIWRTIHWQRSPLDVINSCILFIELSVIGIVAIVRYIQKKEWRILAIIAAISGALIFGKMSIMSQMRGRLSFYPIDIMEIVVGIWCISVVIRLWLEIRHEKALHTNNDQTTNKSY